VVGAECVLELDHELVAGVHGVSLGARLDFEGQCVPPLVADRLLVKRLGQYLSTNPRFPPGADVAERLTE